jgi:endoglucanase
LIAGSIIPGILGGKNPTENKEDWAFVWGENKVTLTGCGDYIFLPAAGGQLAAGK